MLERLGEKQRPRGRRSMKKPEVKNLVRLSFFNFTNLTLIVCAQVPLWYDLYEAFPPKHEPRWDREPSRQPLPKILYQEVPNVVLDILFVPGFFCYIILCGVEFRTLKEREELQNY